ncbi:MAG: metallophosphoesterase [Clostridia bacterium]|nr:metallophosphoesterase [Clostridia bacterium]
MALYTIGDLHLSFKVNKPMGIFGDNWDNHENKIKDNWIRKVKEEDTVMIPGDFSWATYLEDSIPDFEFLNSLPGKKLLSKGNHDYWWTTLTQMRKFLKENNFENIDFVYNNSYLVEDQVIVATRGWVNAFRQEDNYKILKRERDRLELSLKSAKESFGDNKEIIAFIHYPPFYKEEVPDEINFIKLLKSYGVKRCFYGHLHGESHKEAIEGLVDGIDFKLVSSDYLQFDLVKID